MKSVDKIPTSKLKRASKILGTGAKVGGNYAKYYLNRVVKSKEDAQKQLDEDNAEDIYNSLQELKGSALKMAQMMSMDKNALPQAYVDKFSLSQFSVPPLSYPLVAKTFKQELGKSPKKLFDSFDKEAKHAASIGQVHKAILNGKYLAVKIQYPGVAESISSDLALVKPMAKKLFNIKGKESDKYFKEVENKLLEETNYKQELNSAQRFEKKCADLSFIEFPKYYPKYSSSRILTMDWIDGVHLSEIDQLELNQEERNELAQNLWDFYMFQFHNLHEFQADPHPGNFLVKDRTSLVALDFGCTKVIPDDFYKSFAKLLEPDAVNNKQKLEESLFELEFLKASDKKEDQALLSSMITELLKLIARPFHKASFDFSDQAYFNEIVTTGEKMSKDKNLKKLNTSRGSTHLIYVNRTFFGLYNLMHMLNANKTVIKG